MRTPSGHQRWTDASNPANLNNILEINYKPTPNRGKVFEQPPQSFFRGCLKAARSAVFVIVLQTSFPHLS